MYDLQKSNSLESIADTLIKINANLGKIIDKNSEVSIPTIQAIGNAFAQETKRIKELNLDTITCNQNKDSYVDKNIIS